MQRSSLLTVPGEHSNGSILRNFGAAAPVLEADISAADIPALAAAVEADVEAAEARADKRRAEKDEEGIAKKSKKQVAQQNKQRCQQNVGSVFMPGGKYARWTYESIKTRLVPGVTLLTSRQEWAAQTKLPSDRRIEVQLPGGARKASSVINFQHGRTRGVAATTEERAGFIAQRAQTLKDRKLGESTNVPTLPTCSITMSLYWYLHCLYVRLLTR